MKKNEELQKHTLFLYPGDFERLKALYPESGASVVVRKIVRKFLSDFDKKTKGPDLKVEVDGL